MVHLLLRFLIAALALLIGGLALTGQLQQERNLLEQVQAEGRLVVVTRLGPTTLYETGDGLAGMDYDLARGFAEFLGVELRLIIARNKTEMYQTLSSGSAHLAAGALSIVDSRRSFFHYSTPYAEVDQHLIYRRGEPAPESVQELAAFSGARVRVMANSHAADKLRDLSDSATPESWDIAADTDVRELLYDVWTRAIDYTIVDSNALALNQSYYPELRVAFTFDQGQELAWAFLDADDTSLHEAAEEFLGTIRENGTLADIRERYYGYLSGFDYVGARVFLRHVTERLPQFRETFEQAGEEYSVDWRLLAAIGYQESHWDPEAVSPTGVRGLMMLTQRTAAELDVSNRLDPEQSIRGGARYFASLRERLADDIEEPTRTWMALASYNVGMGHLQDARRITEQEGGNPDSWSDIREHLPLLAQPEWYQQTRFGRARGWEPVHYVRGVRSYYALLRRITDSAQFRISPEANPEHRRQFEPRDAGHLQLPRALEALH